MTSRLDYMLRIECSILHRAVGFYPVANVEVREIASALSPSRRDKRDGLKPMRGTGARVNLAWKIALGYQYGLKTWTRLAQDVLTFQFVLSRNTSCHPSSHFSKYCSSSNSILIAEHTIQTTPPACPSVWRLASWGGKVDKAYDHTILDHAKPTGGICQGLVSATHIRSLLLCLFLQLSPTRSFWSMIKVGIRSRPSLAALVKPPCPLPRKFVSSQRLSIVMMVIEQLNLLLEPRVVDRPRDSPLRFCVPANSSA